MSQDQPYRVAPGAEVEDGAVVGEGTGVWQQARSARAPGWVRTASIGRGAYIGPGVVMGDRCKIQNHALVYEPAVLEDGVFVGPAVVFTNDTFPRAVTPDGRLKTRRRLARGRGDRAHRRVGRGPGRVRRAGHHRRVGDGGRRGRGDHRRGAVRAGRRGAGSPRRLGR